MRLPHAQPSINMPMLNAGRKMVVPIRAISNMCYLIFCVMAALQAERSSAENISVDMLKYDAYVVFRRAMEWHSSRSSPRLLLESESELPHKREASWFR